MLITHKLAEAIAVADRITVLRRGRVVARTTPAETSEEQLAELMIGEIVIQPDAGAARRQPGEPVLQVENLTLDDYPGRRTLTAFRCALARAKSWESPASTATGRPSWSKCWRACAIRAAEKQPRTARWR